MKKFLSNRKLNIIYSALAIILMWVVWIIAYRGVGNDLVVPSYQETFKEFWNCCKSVAFWTAVRGTFLRTMAAFAVSFVLAGVCAALACLAQPLRAFFRPIMAFVRILPTLAVILIILRWTEYDKNIAPVIVTVLVLFPMIYAQIMAAADGVDGGLKNLVKVYGIGKVTAFFKIYLPAVSPNVLAQIGPDISLGLKIMVSGEVLAFTAKGIGGQMQNANISQMGAATLAALTLAVVIIGLVSEIIFSRLTLLTNRWSKKEGNA